MCSYDPNNLPSNDNDNNKEKLLALLLAEEGFDPPIEPAIKPRARTANPPLSFAQQRLWFLDQLEPNSPAYNIFQAFRLTGSLDITALTQSLNEIVRRHESLRTTFSAVLGKPAQVIAARLRLNVPLIDLRQLPKTKLETIARQRVVEEARLPFDLSQDPLLRALLLRLAGNQYLFCLTMHHIISDGWSWDVFNRELSILYRTFSTGEPSPLPDLPIQYADYALWQREWLPGEVLARQLTYWEKQLGQLPPALELATDHPRPARRSYRGSRRAISLPPALTQALKSLSRREEVTLFMTLLAAFKTLLCRYTAQLDIAIGSPIAGRNRSEIEDLIGFFANTQVLRTDLSGNPTFRQLLRRVNKMALEAYEHQDLPLEMLVEKLQPERNLNQSPLFQVMFVFQNTLQEELILPGLDVRPLETNRRVAKFDLTLNIVDTPQGLQAAFIYGRDLFEAATIERMLGHFQTILSGIVANPEAQLSDLPLLTPPEREQLLLHWNDTAHHFANQQALHQIFEAQAGQTPKARAVVFENQALTYQELNARANQLAHYLQKQGARPETLVGLCTERSLEMAVGLLGVLKAGGGYVPIDPKFPRKRQAYMLAGAKATLLLTQAHLVGDSAEDEMQYLCLDADWATIAQEPTTNPSQPVPLDAAAYVIYTSGSTGKPKGVVIEQRQILNYVQGIVDRLGIESGANFAMVQPLSVDSSQTVIFPAFYTGGTLHLISEDRATNPDALGDYFAQHAIDLLKIAPSHLAALQTGRHPEQVLPRRWLIVGGEASRRNRLEQIQAMAPQCAIFNHYGPTEATVGVLTYRLGDRQNQHPPHTLPLGRPLPNTQAYILDRGQKPVPIGIPGELYIGGACLARGYLGDFRFPIYDLRLDSGAKKIPAEEICPKSKIQNLRLYRTGDIARYLFDGNIEFLGRADQQVKIQGFRIELGEIEAVIAQHPKVREAVVLAPEDQANSRRLVAYLVSSGSISTTELRRHLREKLPGYMVPGVFVFLAAMPRTPHGKLNRRELPVPKANEQALERAIVKPQTPAEQTLHDIWTRVLGLEQIGVHDNFFELGGDSILSIQIIARANQTGLRLTPRQLFEHQTISGLAAVAESKAYVAAQQTPVSGDIPLTPIQRRFLAQNLAHPHHWNMARLLEVEPDLNLDCLAQALQHLLEHHDALRMRFTFSESGRQPEKGRREKGEGRRVEQTGHPARRTIFEKHYPVQQVNAGLGETITLAKVDLSGLPEDKQAAAIEVEGKKYQAGLNLSTGPSLRAVHFNLVNLASDVADGKPNKLLLIIHHLVVDGVSWQILLADLGLAYDQLRQGQAIHLPPKTTPFKAWAERLAEYARSDSLQAEKRYWLSHLPDRIPPLPTDYPQNSESNTEASAQTITTALTVEETEALLRKVPSVYNTQINEVLLTALTQAFAHWRGERSLLLNLEGHGREDLFAEVDLTRTVGWFTTHFPIFLADEDLRGFKNLGGLAGSTETDNPGAMLKTIKERLRQVPKHGIGYGLLRYLNPDEKFAARLQALPQPEVSFNYLGQLDHELSAAGSFRLAQESPGGTRDGQNRRGELLYIGAQIRAGSLRLAIEYSHNHYRAATIEQLARNFREALQSLINHCLSPEAGGYTPSDFPLATVDQAQLDHLAASYPNLHDLYPLTPMQQEMLHHSGQENKSLAYFVQLSGVIQGDLDNGAFRRAWQTVVGRHPVLRTAFAWEKLTEPHQVVYKEVDLPWEEQDWRDLTPTEQSQRLADYLAADRRRGFDIKTAPMFRLSLIRLAADRHQFTWSHHHLLTDGWSKGQILQEVALSYESFRRGTSIELKSSRPYRDYISWLHEQDRAKAKAFWRKMLEDFTNPTTIIPYPKTEPRDEDLPGFENLAGLGHSRDSYAECQLTLSPAITAALQRLARQHHLTLNTLVLGAWALLLSHYSGQESVSFGMTVSGRPAKLAGGESMVGLFINTLPLHVSVPAETDLLSWVQDLQAQQLQVQQYAYNSLRQIRAWANIPEETPLYESTFRFQSYPSQGSWQNWEGALTIAEVQGVDWWPYPLNVEAVPGHALLLRISYQRRYFTEARVREILAYFRAVLEGLIEELKKESLHRET